MKHLPQLLLLAILPAIAQSAAPSPTLVMPSQLGCPLSMPLAVLVALPGTGQVICAQLAGTVAPNPNGVGYTVTVVAPASTAAAGPNFVDGETPGGTLDGSNTSFTLARAPAPAASLLLIRNGIVLSSGRDYTLSGSTITFAAAAVPKSGDLLVARYRF